MSVPARDTADEPAISATTAPPGPLQDSATAPLAGGGTAPSPLAVRLDLAATRQIRFKKPPRSALLFDLDTGRVLYRDDPTRVLPIASLTKMMTALVVVDRVKPGSKVRITKEALRYQGLGRRPAAARQVDRRQHDAPRPDAAVRQRRRDRARPARRGGSAALRALHEREGRADGARLHALLDAERVRGPRQPLVRRGSRGDRARRAARAAAGADRGASARRSCRSRSRAESSTSTTTTRCCGRAIAARPASRRATPTPRDAAWSPRRAAERSSSASSCWTRPTPANKRCSCWTGGSRPQGPYKGVWPPVTIRRPSTAAGASWRSSGLAVLAALRVFAVTHCGLQRGGTPEGRRGGSAGQATPEAGEARRAAARRPDDVPARTSASWPTTAPRRMTSSARSGSARPRRRRRSSSAQAHRSRARRARCCPRWS